MEFSDGKNLGAVFASSRITFPKDVGNEVASLNAQTRPTWSFPGSQLHLQAAWTPRSYSTDYWLFALSAARVTTAPLKNASVFTAGTKSGGNSVLKVCRATAPAAQLSGKYVTPVPYLPAGHSTFAALLGHPSQLYMSTQSTL